MGKIYRQKVLFLLSLFLLSAAWAWTNDWPQWLGPQGDSVWREDGIVQRIPENGLPVLWRTEIGLGYAGPAVADGRVYVMDYLLESGEVKNDSSARDRTTGKERVLCFREGTGEILWKHEYDRPYDLSFAGGPRCTPAVANGKVYALGAEGNLWCLDAVSGKVIWSVDYVKDYAAKTPMWGFAAHPLVERIGRIKGLFSSPVGNISLGFKDGSMANNDLQPTKNNDDLFPPRAPTGIRQNYCPNSPYKKHTFIQQDYEPEIKQCFWCNLLVIPEDRSKIA